MKVATGGGPPTTLASSGQAGLNGIAVDDTSVYWTNTNGGTVMKLTPKQCGREPCHSPAAGRSRRRLEPHQHAGQGIGHGHDHSLFAHFESADLAFTSVAQSGASDGAAGAGQAYLD